MLQMEGLDVLVLLSPDIITWIGPQAAASTHHSRNGHTQTGVRTVCSLKVEAFKLL